MNSLPLLPLACYRVTFRVAEPVRLPPYAGSASFWLYLWLGQWTHAGKGTSMGLGKYRIEAA